MSKKQNNSGGDSFLDKTFADSLIQKAKDANNVFFSLGVESRRASGKSSKDGRVKIFYWKRVEVTIPSGEVIGAFLDMWVTLVEGDDLSTCTLTVSGSNNVQPPNTRCASSFGFWHPDPIYWHVAFYATETSPEFDRFPLKTLQRTDGCGSVSHPVPATRIKPEIFQASLASLEIDPGSRVVYYGC